MPLVALNGLLSLSAIAGSWRTPTRQPLYFSMFLILETAVAGVFTSVDLFLFFLFWELELMPMLNVRPEDAVLLIAWLLGAMRPRGPYPVLSLNGEQGSGKSGAVRMLKDNIF